MKSISPQVGDIWHCSSGNGLYNYYALVLEEIELIGREASYLCLRLDNGRKVQLGFANEEWRYTHVG